MDENEVTANSHDGNSKKVPGRPFIKGDPRINRAGRPKVESFRSLIQSLPAERRQRVIERLMGIVDKGRPGDAIRAAEFLAKHGEDQTDMSLVTETFTINFHPGGGSDDEEEEDDDE